MASGRFPSSHPGTKEIIFSKRIICFFFWHFIFSALDGLKPEIEINTKAGLSTASKTRKKITCPKEAQHSVVNRCYVKPARYKFISDNDGGKEKPNQLLH